MEQCQKQGCTTSGDTYYLFDKNSLEPIGEPSEVKADLYQNLPVGTTRADTRVVAVPRGTVVVEDVPKDDPATADVDESDAPSSFFVLHDRPALSGDEITDPKPGTDQFNQPTVDFNFTDSGREAFSNVTADIAARGADACAQANGGAPCAGISSNDAANFSGSFAIVLDGELVSNPIINFVDNPAGIDGRTGAQISGVSAQEANDLAEVLQDRRAADQARADQPVDGLGDARPAGARSGPEGGLGRARPRPLLPDLLLPLPRRRSLRSG